MTKDQYKAIQKAEKERKRDKYRTLNMLEKLDIDKVKLNPEMLAKPQESKKKAEEPKSTTSTHEMLDSLQ